MKKIRFIIPIIVCLIILLVMFYIDGLYPFGNNSLVQVDADYQFIPILYRIYDFIHGNGSIIYDDIGFGNNIFISMVIQGSIFSPLSLLLFFTSRDNIVNYFNIIVMIKICLISLTSYIYINRSFKVNEYYKIMFSVLYAFSGWVLLNYFNVMWLDSVILFPLIVMYLERLLKDGKYIGYVICLSLSLIISYYISYFILLFILFYSFMYIFLKLDKSKIKNSIFRLGICTFIAILISSFSLLPSLYQTFISSRLDSSYTSEIISNFMNKSLYLMFSSVFLVFFVKLIFKYKNDSKNIYFYLILFILFGIGLLIEPINLAIHMGSYWSFPYRYSFITLFILMNGSLYYISKYNNDCYGDNEWIRIILFILLFVLLGYGNYLFCDDIRDSLILLDFKDKEIYLNILVMFLGIVMMIIISLSFKNNYYKYISFSIVCLFQIFIYSSWCIYYNDGYYLSKKANEINSNIDIIDDDLERYKMGYNYYTPDYGFIYDVNTLDNWLHILPDKEIDIYKKLGYGNSDTCIRSYGGTILSDWLFNVGYLLDNEYLADDMYTMINSYDGYYLYEYNYNNEFGLIYDNNNIDSSEYKDLNGFELHNKIYKDLLDKDNNIVKIDNYSFDNIDGSINIDYNIDKKGFLYMDLYNDEGDISYIFVNNKSIEYTDGNYIIDLGIYDSNVKIEIGVNDIDNIVFDLGFIQYSDIIDLDNNEIDVVRNNSGYDISLYNDMDNGSLFLPINKIDGLYVYVNGHKVEIDSYMDNFVLIKLDNGDNRIEIRYEMPLLKLGILFSLIGIVCLLLFRFIFVNKVVLNVIYYVYIFVCLLFYLYIYGYSMIKYWNY